jgi:hypothetical protein
MKWPKASPVVARDQQKFRPRNFLAARTPANFRSGLDTGGAINSADATIVRARSRNPLHQGQKIH